MNLQDVISRLPEFSEDATLFLAMDGPIDGSTEAAVGFISDDDTPPAEARGLSEFIDIWNVREVLDGKANLAGLTSRPSIEQQIEFLRDYLENDC